MWMSDLGDDIDDGAAKVAAASGGCPVWPADWWREGLIRPDRYVAMRQLLCPQCGKTGHVAGDCGNPRGQCPGEECYRFQDGECVRLCAARSPGKGNPPWPGR
jgi:hypothetical protein